MLRGRLGQDRGWRKKLAGGTIADWKFLEKMEMEEQEKEEARLQGPKQRLREHVQKKGRCMRPLGH